MVYAIEATKTAGLLGSRHAFIEAGPQYYDQVFIHAVASLFFAPGFIVFVLRNLGVGW